MYKKSDQQRQRKKDSGRAKPPGRSDGFARVIDLVPGANFAPAIENREGVEKRGQNQTYTGDEQDVLLLDEEGIRNGPRAHEADESEGSCDNDDEQEQRQEDDSHDVPHVLPAMPDTALLWL